MSDLYLNTFGGVRVLLDQQDITAQLPSKAVGLLVYLAAHHTPKSREHLAELFWPDRRTEQAYSSLRTALGKMRSVIGDTLQASQKEIGVSAALDLDRFADGIEDAATRADALHLYQGDFMAGFFAGDARQFEHWQLREAENWHERFVLASLQHIQNLKADGQFEKAILCARHALNHAPLREDLHRALIQLYHVSGERAAALRQYNTCRSLLWEELGVEPDAVTQALMQQVEHLPAISSLSPTSRNKLPARITSFVGGAESLRKIEALLADTQLLTITATGGMGKTRHALEIAHRLSKKSDCGVGFIDLTKISQAKDVPSLIMATIGLPENPHQDVMTQIQHYLQDEDFLLILDNFEHVTAAASLVSDLIASAPRLRVLVTSREPLKLYGEQLFHLAPLSPTESTQLFRERVRAIAPDFQRTEAVDKQIESICRHLEGLPLAIELAAMRYRTMSLTEILHGLTSQLELLTSDLRDVPARQRALFHTIEWSYKLLTPEQATLFRRLAVFRGGWTRQALQHISSHAVTLHDLVDKNLVKRSLSGVQRYMMLESIREYALYQLRQHDEEADAQAAHAGWILGFAEAIADDIRTERQPQAMAATRDERDNIRAALDYLADRGDQLTTYARIISALSWYWNMEQFNEMPFEHANRAIARVDALPPALAAHLLTAGGHSAHGLGRYALADEWHGEALRIFESIGDKHHAVYVKAFSSPRAGSETVIRDILLDLREYARKRDDDFLLCLIDLNLGHTLHFLRDYRRGQMVLQEGLTICEKQNFIALLSFFCINLSNLYTVEGHITEAFALLERAYTIGQATDSSFTQAISLIEMGEILLNTERWDMGGYLDRAEQPLHELNSSELYARFYNLRCMVAFASHDRAALRTHYRQYLRHVSPENVHNVHSVMFVLMRFALLHVEDGDLSAAARILGTLDRYTAQKAAGLYPHIVESWRAQIIDAINSASTADDLHAIMRESADDDITTALNCACR